MNAREQIRALQERMAATIIGQEAIVERLVIGLLANGNLLVEGLPGLRHRLQLSYEASADGLSANDVVDAIVEKVAVA